MASAVPPKAPRRITASNLPLSSSDAPHPKAEPAVEIFDDTLKLEPILGGSLVRARVATHKQIPTNNDGLGDLPLDDVPGFGIVMPNGLNMYYLDVAPNTEGTMHRTTSTDYLIVLQGTLSLLTPQTPFNTETGYAEPKETLCQVGDIVVQRGIMHALSNRTDQWVRVVAVVADSAPNRIPIEGSSSSAPHEQRVLDDAWLA
ncbi:putative cupin domain-containing protein [Rosellinia necatrix]|uniref:Putative cupin domain-containing protein n=1 Tax=Rosellinia necatrix TaxID=77044 RepID=A0A1W2TPA8_ROSNE|nr:putative cupin domain-containing protein [Rosellinia necatrix]